MSAKAYQRRLISGGMAIINKWRSNISENQHHINGVIVTNESVKITLSMTAG